MKRLFVAIPYTPSKELLQWIATLKKQLHYESISWVKTENLHLTLKFLGETNESKIPSINNALQSSIEGLSIFEFQIDKYGVFGSTYQPRVIWLGSTLTNDLMNMLGNNVLSALESVGFERDSQNFVPHLSLARIKKLKDKQLFRKILDEAPAPPKQIIKVSELCLYESILQKEGPRYHLEQAFVL